MIMNIWSAAGPAKDKERKTLMTHRLVVDGVVAVFAELMEEADCEELAEKIFAAFRTTLYDAATTAGLLEDLIAQEDEICSCGIILLNDAQIIVGTAGDCATYEAKGNKLTRLCDHDEATVDAVAIPNELEARDAYLMVSKGLLERLDKVAMTIDYCKSNTPKQWVDYMMLRAERDEGMHNVAAFALMAE